MPEPRIRPFSQKNWQERQILYAAEQRRKKRYWYVIGLMLAVLFIGLLVGVSITAFPEPENEPLFTTGE